MDWLQDRHPDDLLIASQPTLTEEDALAADQARARHVDECAAYLQENGCPSSGC